MSDSSPDRRDIVALTLAAASWGVGTVVSKRALEEIAPLTLLTIQLAASLTFLAVLMRLQGMRLLSDRSGSPSLGRLGILNPGLAYALSLLGLASISASLSVLIWAVEPLLILALAGLVLRERIGPPLVVLSIVAAGGMFLVIYDPASGGQWPGIVLTLAGVACCAIYTIVARRWIGTAASTAQVVVTQQAYALVFALAVLVGAALLGGDLAVGSVTPIGWLSAAGSGVLYYGAAYWFYLNGLKGVPASVAAASFYLIPVFGVAAGILLLGEQLEAMQWLGGVIVLVAVLLIAGRAADPSHAGRAVSP